MTPLLNNPARGGKSHIRMFPCGCYLNDVRRSAGVIGFTYCPMHRAAPDLLTALKKTASVISGDSMSKQGLIDALEAARAALRLAEPRKDPSHG